MPRPASLNGRSAFTPDALSRVLFSELKLPPAMHYTVAFSGGADSTALVHALASLAGERLRITALHADHGLAPDSALWAAHCRRVCNALGVPISVRKLNVRTDPAQGVEASARHERYRWFAGELGVNDVLLTAHHRDDQAETVLLRLLRGAGVRGLAGIPAVRPLGAGRLVRPLLGFAREELLAYNRRHDLPWIEDPANRDAHFNRSYLRRDILPRLQERWPAVTQRLAQTAHHHREAATLLEGLAEGDIAEAGLGPIPWAPGYRARAVPLERLAPERQANALRHMLRQCGFEAPSTPCLQRALERLLRQSPCGASCAFCEGLVLRRYDDWLELAGPLPPVSPRWQWTWTDFPEPLALPELGVRLHADTAKNGALALDRMAAGPVTVRLRRGGERVRLPGRTHRHTLKNLLNEARVPPWHRDRLPLLYVGGEIAALAGVCACAPFACAPGEHGWRIQIMAS
jgi:tRNA(Ile)-lysidine synthase